MIPLGRRDFVRLGAGAIAVTVLGGCAALMTRRVSITGGRIELDMRQFPELGEPGGAVRLLPDGWTDPIYLLTLESGDFAALSPICTHLACTVELSGSRLVCPCHGSTYSRDGQVLQGPAERPLARYPVRVGGDGVLAIDVGGAR